MGSRAQAQRLWLHCSKTGGIFPDQGLSPCLLHWQADSLPVSHQGSPSDSDSDVSPSPLGQKRSFDESYKPWELGFGLVLLSFRLRLSIFTDLLTRLLLLGLGTAVSSKVGQTDAPLPSTWVSRDLAFLLILHHPQRSSCNLRSCSAAAAAAAAKSLQPCLTLRDPIDGSPPGSPIPGILQARTLGWVASAFPSCSALALIKIHLPSEPT